MQDSTQVSPFHLIYGRDPRIPTETALTQPTTPYQVDIRDYRTKLVTINGWFYSNLAASSLNLLNYQQDRF